MECLRVFALVVMLCVSVSARTITLRNQCAQTLWAASSQLPNNAPNGWTIPAGQSTSFTVPDDWSSGRVWARTNCVVNAQGHLECATGDCPLPAPMYNSGNNGIYCNYIGGKPPASVIELTLRGNGSPVDTYDLSLVDGYNVPVQISPTGSYTPVNNPGLGKYNCGSPVIHPMTANQCPPEMRKTDSNGNFQACWSPCKAWHDPDQTFKFPVIKTWDESLICCNCGDQCGLTCGCETPGCKHGCSWMDKDPAHADRRCFDSQWPLTSWGTTFPSVFKSISPDAYSWQFDDSESTYQCIGANYDITFCPESVTPAPTCTGQTVQVAGTDLYGSDISNTPATTLAACIQQCQTTNGCSAVTLSSGVCYLKNAQAATNQKPCAGCQSAYCIPSPQTCTAMQQLAAVDLFGSDLSHAPAANIAACIAQCQAASACRAATLSGGVCYLKTAAALSNQQYCAGCVSAYCAGTDHCPNWVTAANTDLNGGDLSHAAGTSIAACQAQCQAEPACVGATLFQNVCYLKQGASLANKQVCTGCTSGKCGGNLAAAVAAAAAAAEKEEVVQQSAAAAAEGATGPAAPAAAQPVAST